MIRRIAIEPLESRRLLAATGSISGSALLPGGAGFAGLTVQVSPQGNPSDVLGVTQTDSNGAYSVAGLAAGSYQIDLPSSELSKLAMGTPTPGAAGGNAVGSAEIDNVTLTDGQSATDYNFAVLGAQTSEISLRMFLSSTGPLSQFLTTLHSKPSVAPTGSGSTSYTTNYTTGGSGAAIAPSATLVDSDSPTLTSMTVSIQNPPDGGSELLTAVTTGTTLTSNSPSGVLTVSGVADLSVYQTVLDSLLYSDTATPATAGDRTISITVDDGTTSSTATISTVNVALGTQTAPTVTAVSSTQAAGSYAAGTTIPISVTFSEAVTVTGTPELTLNDGAVVDYASGSGTSTLSFSYVVAAGQNTTDLDYASTGALALNGGTIEDATGNAAVLTLPATGTDGLATQNIIIDTTPPAVTAVTSTQAAGSYAAGTTIPISVVFGETVTVTGTPQLTLNDGAVVDYTSGSGTATLSFSYVVATGQNTADLDYASTGALALNGGTIVDAAGNAAALTLPATGTDGLATQKIVIDTTPPAVTAVSSTQAAGVYGVGTTIPISVTFGEAVTVTGTPQLTLNDGAVVGYASGSGTATLTFSYVVAASQNTTDLDYASTGALALNGGTILDAASNAAVLTLPATGTDGLATQKIVIDTTARGVTAVSTTQATGAYGAGTTIPITVTFGEAVTVTGTPQLTLNDGAVVNYASGSGTATLTFSYVVAAGQNTTDLDYASTGALALNGGSILDPAGDAALLTLPATGTDGLATQNIVIETAAPAVTQVASTKAAGAYTTGTTIPITVTFGHAVTVTGTPQLTLNDGAVVNYASGSGTATLTFNYVVAAGQNTADLDYASTGALALNGGTIQDAAGNAAVLVLPTTGADGLATQKIIIDTTPPAVTAVASTQAAGVYGVGTTIPITVTFGEAVTVTGTPQLTLNDGAVVNYASGSGTTTLTFSYAIAAGQNTADLDYASTTALALNGGTILDAAGNAAVLTLPATGTDGLATQKIIIDATPRAVTGVSTTQATGAYGLGTTIPITVTFGEAVTVTGTPQLTLNDGATANYASGSGTATLTFSYVVAAGQDTADLDYASTAALTLNGGSILDAAGNAALLTLPPTGSDGLATKNIAIETTAPTVTVVSSTQAAGAYTTGTTIPITVTFSHAVVVTGTPQLALNDGVSVNYASGSGTATLSFSYVVETGQNTADLDYASTAALALNGGTIQDAVGNVAVLTLPATGTDGLATRNIVIDTTPPAVTAVSSAQAAGVYGAGTTIPITITFGETVNVTGTPQLTLNNGATANYASGSGTATLSFSYVVVAGQDTADLDYASTTALALNGGTIQDAATNAAVLTLPTTGTDGLATQKIVIDTTPRQVTGVSTTQATGAYTVGTTIPITVTFGEAVTVTGTPQLTLNDGAVVNYASGSGTPTLTFSYLVAAGQNTTNLDYSSTAALTLNGGSILDAAGNPALLTLPATGTDGLATQKIIIDTTPPAVTGVASTKAAGAYGVGTTIPITVTFGEAVTVTGTPQLALDDGAVVNYTSGSGTATLSFSYLVAAGQNTTDLDYTSTTALALNGGSIKDAAGNVAVLTLPATGTDGLATQKIVIDTTPPMVTGVASTQAAGIYSTGTTIPITVNFSEAVTVTGTPQLTLNDGAVVNYASGSGTSTLSFAYVVAAGDHTTDLDYASTTALALNGGTIQDAASNAAVLTLPATQSDGLATRNIVIETVSADQPYLGPTNDTAAGFTVNGGTVGQGYTISVSSSGGGSTFSSSGTLGSTVQDFPGLNLSTLPAGTVTYTVTLAGNPSPLTATALLKTPPSGYSVKVDQDSYNLITGKSVSFTVSNAEIGANLNYQVFGSTSGFLNVNVPVTSSTQHVTGIDISSFPAGPITFHITLTDSGGNEGPEVPGSTSLNATVPPAFSISPNPSVIDGYSAANTGFKFGDAEVGDTYTYSVVSSGTAGPNQVSQVTGGSTVPLTSASQNVTGINVSNLPDGQLTYSVTLTNPVGNPTTETATATLEETDPTVAPDQNPITGGAITSNGFTLANAEPGATFTYTVSDSSTPANTQTGSGTVTSAAQDITGINLSTFADGKVTYSVNLTDTAGNSTSTPITATATMDHESPAAIELSTSIAPAGAQSGSRVAVLETVSSNPTAAYTYTLLTQGTPFSISGDELLTNGSLGAAGTSYNISVESTEPSSDPQDKSITQSFTITVGSTDPVSLTLGISNSSVASGQAGATVGALQTSGTVGGQIDYSLVPGTGSTNNNLFKIVNGQLETASALTAGTYTVRVRTSSSYLVSDVVNLTGPSGPYGYQVSYDPAEFPSSSYLTAAVNAGLVSLSSESTGGWSPAVSANQEPPGSQAQLNYPGPYSSFTAANSSATLQQLVGSSGIDTAGHTAWAVVDQPGQFAVGVQVFTEETFTITVS